MHKIKIFNTPSIVEKVYYLYMRLRVVNIIYYNSIILKLRQEIFIISFSYLLNLEATS